MLLGRNVHFSTVLKRSKKNSSVTVLLCSTVNIIVWQRDEQRETQRKGNIRGEVTEKLIIEVK